MNLAEFISNINTGVDVDLGTLFGDGDRIDLMDRLDNSEASISLLNRYNSEINVVHGFDGLYDQWETPPIPADEKAGGILYVLMTQGYFHKVKAEALEVGDYYHHRFVEATMYYAGQQS